MPQTPKILMAFVLAILLALGNVDGQTTNEDRDDAIAKKLDEILKRLDTIESRLAKLEAHTVNRWRAGERGLLLDGDGKPLGFWGIDSVIQQPVRR